MENIAGLYDVSIKHPESFRQDTITKAIKRYLKDIKISNELLNKKNHLIVYHEELAKNPEHVIRNACDKLGINYEENMLKHTNILDKIIGKEEVWKKNNFNEIKLTEKYKERLTEEQIKIVLSKIQLNQFPILKYYEKN